ncbi:MAG: O-antigen ligase family protein [Anaerolineales bacterium]
MTNGFSVSAYAARLARLAFAATIIAIPFRYRVVLAPRPFPPIYGDYTDFLLFAGDAFLVATLLLWLIATISGRRRIAWGPAFLTLPMAALVVLGLATSAASADPPLSLYHSVRLLLLAGLYLYVVNEITSLSDVIWPLAVQVPLQSVVAIAQILNQGSVGLAWLGELELDPAWSGVSIVWAEGVRSLRAYGLTDHPNILGGSLAFALVLLTAWYIESGSRRRALVVGVCALGSLSLFLTFSRAAWLALAVAGVWMVAIFIRTRQFGMLEKGAYLAAAGAFVTLPFVWQYADIIGVRLNRNAAFVEVPIESRSLEERSALSDAANELFAAQPVAGVGLGAFPRALQSTRPNFEFYYQPVHMALLDVAAETGIFGGLAYAVLMLSPWSALLIRRRQIQFTPLLVGASGALLAITTVGLFDYYPWLLTPGRLWQWLLWGLWAVAFQSAQVSETAT